MVQEFVAVWRAARGADLSVGWVTKRLEDYSRSIPDYTASVKEWRWRNGWMIAAARRYRVSIPLHVELLRAAGHADEVDATLAG
ncbi:MAG: hypothetical protein EP330_29455 [Deltaproteobacteria bacterium]|nr:MAG: hypothetical protein EP330_29455 [Deltaproteobacteria bacterium]